MTGDGAPITGSFHVGNELQLQTVDGDIQVRAGRVRWAPWLTMVLHKGRGLWPVRQQQMHPDQYGNMEWVRPHSH